MPVSTFLAPKAFCRFLIEIGMSDPRFLIHLHHLRLLALDGIAFFQKPHEEALKDQAEDDDDDGLVFV